MEGLLKPLALAGIAFAAVAGFFHWIAAGPNEVQPEDEAAAQLIGCCTQVRSEAAMSYPRGTIDPQHDRGADQPLDHRRLLRAAVAVRPVDVPPDAVLSLVAVWRRPMDAGGSSLDRLRAAGELCRPDRAVLARQYVDPGRYRLDAPPSTACCVNEEEGVPEVARFNAGQKFVFWSMALLVPALFFTGLVIWEVYFSSYTTIEQQRIAAADP